jgi:hypothetical protein
VARNLVSDSADTIGASALAASPQQPLPVISFPGVPASPAAASLPAVVTSTPSAVIQSQL